MTDFDFTGGNFFTRKGRCRTIIGRESTAIRAVAQPGGGRPEGGSSRAVRDPTVPPARPRRLGIFPASSRNLGRCDTSLVGLYHRDADSRALGRLGASRPRPAASRCRRRCAAFPQTARDRGRSMAAHRSRRRSVQAMDASVGGARDVSRDRVAGPAASASHPSAPQRVRTAGVGNSMGLRRRRFALRAIGAAPPNPPKEFYVAAAKMAGTIPVR